MSRRVRGWNQAFCPDPSSLSAHALPGQKLNDHLLYPRPNTRHGSHQPPGGGAAGLDWLFVPISPVCKPSRSVFPLNIRMSGFMLTLVK